MNYLEKKVKYVFVDEKSDLYEQIIDLRYEEFYRNFNRTKESIFDEFEKNSIRVAACIDEMVIGHARLFINEDNSGEITQVVIHKDYRGMKIGRGIMKVILECARENNVNMVGLDARIYAINFYTNLGFNTTGDIFTSKKTGLPHIRMEKRFDI